MHKLRLIFLFFKIFPEIVFNKRFIKNKPIRLFVCGVCVF